MYNAYDVRVIRDRRPGQISIEGWWMVISLGSRRTDKESLFQMIMKSTNNLAAYVSIGSQIRDRSEKIGLENSLAFSWRRRSSMSEKPPILFEYEQVHKMVISWRRLWIEPSLEARLGPACCAQPACLPTARRVPPPLSWIVDAPRHKNVGPGITQTVYIGRLL